MACCAEKAISLGCLPHESRSSAGILARDDMAGHIKQLAHGFHDDTESMFNDAILEQWFLETQTNPNPSQKPLRR